MEATKTILAWTCEGQVIYKAARRTTQEDNDGYGWLTVNYLLILSHAMMPISPFQTHKTKVLVWKVIFIKNMFQGLTVLSKSKVLSFVKMVHFSQGCSQPHSPGWARVPLSSFFPQISINFSSNCTYFLPHFGSPGGRLAHPGRPWLRHWFKTNLKKTLHSLLYSTSQV